MVSDISLSLLRAALNVCADVEQYQRLASQTRLYPQTLTQTQPSSANGPSLHTRAWPEVGIQLSSHSVHTKHPVHPCC